MKGSRRIVVAMSGGVDSSVTAALLRQQGHDVMGITLRVFDPSSCQEGQEKTCCSARDIRDARRAAAALDIPFSSWDVRRQFEEEVIAPFVEEYRRGRTPNPCIRCNSKIKFSVLLEKARSLGADNLATGHYARIEGSGGDRALMRGRDGAKDQSYFLFEMGADVLSEVIFPLGDMTKEEVRRRAGDLGLEVAGKRESQEICFVPGNDYGAFLEEKLKEKAGGPGPVVDGRGRRLGSHRGLIHYTVGQRRGLGIAAERPLYVVRIDGERNQLIVGPLEALARKTFEVGGMTWPGRERSREFRAGVKIRSRHREAPATVTPLGDGFCRVEFDGPQRAVTPGQAAVFYDGDRVIGGGWIEDGEAG
jgi:tRNA-specific 2-thiouridylase